MASNIIEQLKTVPKPILAGFAGLVIVGGIVVYENSKKSASVASQTNTSQATYTPPLATDFMSNPNTSSGVPDSTYSPTLPTTPTTPTGGSGLTGMSPISGTFPAQETIRSKGTLTGYDSKYNGVPIRSTPSGDGSIIRLAGYGSPISVTGSAVTGLSNFGGRSSDGSDLWYPVTGGGYISAYDIPSVGSGSNV